MVRGRHRIAGIAAVGALALMSLTGCSAASKAVGCVEVVKAAQTLEKSSSSAMGDASSDPKAAVDKLDVAAKAFDKAVDRVTDAGVKSKAEVLATSFTKLTSDITTAMNDPQSADSSALQSDLTDVQNATTALQKDCSAKP